MNDKITFKQLYKSKDPDTVVYVIGLFTFSLLAVSVVLMKALHFPTFCVINKLTGAYCPGCGGTRAFMYLLHGKVLRSVVYHPFVPYFCILSVVFYGSQTLRYISRGRIRGLHLKDIYLYIGVGLLILNWVIKNILHFTGVWSM